MKRKLRIIWCVIAPLALIGGLTYFLLDITLINFFIFLGVCIVVNLPMFILAIIEDATGSGRIVTFLIFILFSPIFLIINWFYTVKGLKKGYTGGSGGTRRKQSYSDEDVVDNRKTDSSVLFSAMEKAVSRAISGVKSSGINGYYGKISNWNINYTVTRMFGIRIYGSVTYRLDNYRPDYPESGYEGDMDSALETLNEELESAVEREVERVQSQYQGFDSEWSLSINVEGHLKIN